MGNTQTDNTCVKHKQTHTALNNFICKYIYTKLRALLYFVRTASKARLHWVIEDDNDMAILIVLHGYLLKINNQGVTYFRWFCVLNGFHNADRHNDM